VWRQCEGQRKCGGSVKVVWRSKVEGRSCGGSVKEGRVEAV
jgi:hypothetical protein